MASVHVKVALMVLLGVMVVTVAESASVAEFASDTESDEALLRNEVRVVNAAKPAIYKQKENGEDKTLLLTNAMLCSKMFDFVHIPPSYSMYFTNPSRRGRYISRLNCGWWYWTMQNYHLEVRCSYIEMQKRDYFFFYDNSTAEWTEFTKTKRGTTELIFNSTDVAAGIYTDRRKNAKGFSCIISSVPDYEPPTTTTTSGTTTTTETTPRTTPTTSPTTTDPSSSQCKCGVYKTSSRIVNGTETDVGEYIWIAGLTRRKSNHFHYCGASIITRTRIVTAAHCISGRLPYVTVGMHSRTTDGSYTTVPALQQTIHPNYDSSTIANDIAMLRVAPLTFNERVGPVCLPDDLTVDYVDQIGTAAGWGTTSSGGSLSDVLMEVDILVLSNAVCNGQYGQGAILPSMLCAGDLNNGGEDSCQGDSGGPFIVNDQGSAELIGIVSWGFGCANVRYPGVYSRVTELMPFIRATTQGEEFCPRA